jgi:hypothetical protein
MDEAARVGREQADALRRHDEQRRAAAQRKRAPAADELPNVDGMSTFELRHLAKDLGVLTTNGVAGARPRSTRP